MNIANWLTRAAREFPDRPALGLGAATVADYRTHGDRAARLAAALRERLDLRPGDRVALVMANVPSYVEILFAAWHAGLAAVPVNAKLHAEEIAFILENSGARVCFVTPDTAATVNTAAAGRAITIIETGTPDFAALFAGDPAPVAEAAPDALAWLFYTSGTTGRPKGAMLTHRNLMAATLNYFADFDRVMPGDTILHAAPLSHGSGLWMLPHVVAAACNVCPEGKGFDAAEIFALIPRLPRLSMFAAPTMVRRLTIYPGDQDLANLKLITYGGAPMYVADCVAALDRFGPRLSQLYGQGECPMTITHLSRETIAEREHPQWLDRLATAGVADSCMEVAIADEAGRLLPTGEAGEIVCRGDPVMAGYWRAPEATAATLKDGWLHTGDVGHLDEAGYLTLTDRSKDLIISGGSNVYPREIEEVLLSAEGVAEVSVIGRPDPDWGEAVVAWVVASPGSTLDRARLDAQCLSHIARFKRPKLYRFVPELPKNNYGKVLKTELRQRERSLADRDEEIGR